MMRYVDTKKLRWIRRKKNLSMAAVARLCGVTMATLSNYELGKTTLPADVFVRLLDLYQISLADVLTQERNDRIYE